jgi:hypothetical protein
VGAVFPVAAKQASRIFDEGRTVFVKFTNMTDLKANSKIVFYVTREMRLLGEGTIESIHKIAPSKAWSSYYMNIFLNQDEYEKYTNWSAIQKKPRANAEITVFVLKNIKKYKKNNLTKSVGPSGCYLSEEEYKKISK